MSFLWVNCRTFLAFLFCKGISCCGVTKMPSITVNVRGLWTNLSLYCLWACSAAAHSLLDAFFIAVSWRGSFRFRFLVRRQCIERYVCWSTLVFRVWQWRMALVWGLQQWNTFLSHNLLVCCTYRLTPRLIGPSFIGTLIPNVGVSQAPCNWAFYLSGSSRIIGSRCQFFQPQGGA